MTTSESFYGRGGAIAATFSDRGSANKALTDLHHAGFRTVWLGVTHGDASSSAGVTVESEDAAEGGLMGSLGKFFSGEGTQEQALHQALIAHGLTNDEALRLEATVAAGSAIVTVDGENDPTEAVDILRSNGGKVTGSDLGKTKVATAPVVGASGSAARTVDDDRRIQLREERLLIDKQRVASGEARISKEIVSEQQSIDVPVFHEELFIQRRPVPEGTASTAPIGASQELRIPLSEERVDVQKRTVVTEEVEIGKRQVASTEHISDTVRHEELRVDDGTNVAGNVSRPRNPDLR
jgi:uncharacterized protein (TIGR02271 family)